VVHDGDARERRGLLRRELEVADDPALAYIQRLLFASWEEAARTLDTHWPSRSTSVGDHAPVARTTRSAGQRVPSAARTPTHVFPSSDNSGALNVPALRARQRSLEKGEGEGHARAERHAHAEPRKLAPDRLDRVLRLCPARAAAPNGLPALRAVSAARPARGCMGVRTAMSAPARCGARRSTSASESSHSSCAASAQPARTAFSYNARSAAIFSGLFAACSILRTCSE
jgi:hypothetical protein